MPLLPAEVAAKAFRRRWGRGYDRHQVEAFLREVASDYGAAISRVAALADERTRALADNNSLRDNNSPRNDSGAPAQPFPDPTGSAGTEAEQDAQAIRRRAEQAAATITRHAEQSAAALTRHAESLRSAAHADVDAARRRVEQAERRAQQTEDAARQRWDALHIEIEQRWERLRDAERQLDRCIQQADRALGALRARVVLLDQVNEAVQLIATIRADVQEIRTEPQTPTNGDELTPS